MTLEVARFDSYGIPLAPTLRHVRLAELVNKLLLPQCGAAEPPLHC